MSRHVHKIVRDKDADPVFAGGGWECTRCKMKWVGRTKPRPSARPLCDDVIVAKVMES